MKHFFTGLVFFASIATASAQAKPNIIFIVLDDLNDYVEGYTDMPQVETPNMKALAAEGTLFLNAYSNAAGCAPSRTSFLSGKDLNYSQVYNNSDYLSKFRDNFNAAKHNEEVFSLPEILKDSGGYYTYGINKIFHNPHENDYDKTVDIAECDRTLSWNKMLNFGDTDSTLAIFGEYAFGDFFDWGMIPDSMETMMEDYRTADTAIQFINEYGTGVAATCGNPFFLALGFARPHSQRFIPEKYFPDYYLKDIYQEPFTIPYNYPVGNFPYNGVVQPDQPEVKYADFYALPESSIANAMADFGSVYKDADDFIASLTTLPVIDELLTDDDRRALIKETTLANYQINYMAAVKFVDVQVGRVLDALNAYPDLKENTIIVFISDHGYALGEKRHWTKWTLWETDIRIPVIIADPSRPGDQIAERPVSLIDIFPTICDLADVNYPKFSDGTPYLDGKSIVNLLDDPDMIYESPAITTYKKNTGIGSCFPHHSIRTDRWHYIRYRKNNDGAGPTAFCDSAVYSFEEELYEVGSNREVDPNEWYNLSSNSDYRPVINYLNQWMPDSALYLQRTYKAYIQNNVTECFLKHADTLHLSVELYDTAGILIAPPAGFTYKWTNNFTDDVFYGATADFDLQLISNTDFNNHNSVIIYFEMINDITGVEEAFDLNYTYINYSNEPEATFNVLNEEGLTVCIKDYVVTGEYTNSWWDFGDGHISTDAVPGPYTYAALGDYLIINYLEYGNDSCVLSFTKNITLDNSTIDPDKMVTYYPNPVSNELFITLPDMMDFASLTLFDITGRLISSERYMSTHCNFSCNVDVSDLKPGVYLFVLQTDNESYQAPFIVVH